MSPARGSRASIFAQLEQVLRPLEQDAPADRPRPAGLASSRMMARRGDRCAATGLADDCGHFPRLHLVEMPSTARTTPRVVTKWTCRSSTSAATVLSAAVDFAAVGSNLIHAPVSRLWQSGEARGRASQCQPAGSPKRATASRQRVGKLGHVAHDEGGLVRASARTAAAGGR